MSNHAATLHSTRLVNTGQPPKSGYGFLGAALDELEALPSVQSFLTFIVQSRRNTRPGYPPRILWRAVCIKYLLGEQFTVGLIERLSASPRLRELCGFTNSLPSEATFSRFFKLLSSASGDDFIAEMVEKLKARLPDLGDDVAVDSTDLEAFANPNRKTIRDPDAEWGHRTAKAKSSKGVKKTEPFFGYKMHALNDAVYGAPIAHITLPANANDSPQLPNMVKKAQARHKWLRPSRLLADRGYDSQANHKFLVKHGIVPIIHIRKPTADDGLYDGIYKGIIYLCTFRLGKNPSCPSSQTATLRASLAASKALSLLSLPVSHLCAQGMTT